MTTDEFNQMIQMCIIMNFFNFIRKSKNVYYTTKIKIIYRASTKEIIA